MICGGLFSVERESIITTLVSRAIKKWSVKKKEKKKKRERERERERNYICVGSYLNIGKLKSIQMQFSAFDFFFVEVTHIYII